jgi:hypothetical protein
MSRTGYDARPFGETDAFQPWSMHDFYQHRANAGRRWRYDPTGKAQMLLARLDPIHPSLIGCIYMQLLYSGAPWWCLHRLAMAMSHPSQGDRLGRADTHRYRGPTLHPTAAAAATAGAHKGRPPSELNFQMREVAAHLRSKNMFVQVSRQELQKMINTNYTGELINCWEHSDLGILTSIFLVEKDKTVEIQLPGGKTIELPVLRVICDARAPNTWTTEPSGFQLFSLLSLLQEVSNVMQRAALPLGSGEWYAASLDFRHMFFQIPLPPQLAALFPLKVDDNFLLPRAFPMGWKCSPLVAQAVTWALVARSIGGRAPKWFKYDHAAKNAFGEDGATPRFLHLYDGDKVIGAVFVLLDNVFIVGNNKTVVQDATAHLREACKKCNVVIKGEGKDVGGKEVADNEITTMKQDSTIDFCGIAFGFNSWRVSEKAFGKLEATLPDVVTHRQAAAILGCGMWGKRVRLVDMLRPENRKFMALYGRVAPTGDDCWDSPLDLTEEERRVLQLTITEALMKESQGCLPLWEAPTIKDTSQYQVWACDAAGGLVGYRGRAAAFMGSRVLLDGQLDDVQMICEPATYSRIEVDELHAVVMVLRQAAKMPGWAQVKLVIIVEDNTTVEAWLDRGYTETEAAIPLLREIFTILTPARRLSTVGVDTTVQFADVGTRDALPMDEAGRPRCGWSDVDQAADRFAKTRDAVRRSFATAALAQQLGLTSRVNARHEEE